MATARRAYYAAVVVAMGVLAGVVIGLTRAAVLPGDINSDNKVDVTDLSILLANYGKPASQATNPAADINGNGTVEITDLSVLLTNYGKTNTSGTIISEDFSTAAPGFSVFGGTWAVSGGKYRVDASAPAPSSPQAGLANVSVNQAMVAGDFTLTASMSADASASPWDDAAVVFAYQDANNYYMLLVNEGNDLYTHGLFRVQNGVKTELADLGAVIPAGEDYAVKVTRKGQILQAFIDGQLRASATDGAFGAGKAGFGTWDNTARFDNLVVVQGAPSPSVPPSPSPTSTPPPSGCRLSKSTLVKIMPTGDSITYGAIGGGNTGTGGYRKPLWALAASAGWNTATYGILDDVQQGIQYHDTSHSKHSGVGGVRIDYVQSNMNAWLDAWNPDVILLQIGTNDIIQNYAVADAPNRLSALIDQITTRRPNLQLFVSTITSVLPGNGYGVNPATVTAYNASLTGIVNQKAAAGKKVYLLTLPMLGSGDFGPDGLHPGPVGYSKMAQAWYGRLGGCYVQ